MRRVRAGVDILVVEVVARVVWVVRRGMFRRCYVG